jgi:hypothetical protein
VETPTGGHLVTQPTEPRSGTEIGDRWDGSNEAGVFLPTSRADDLLARLEVEAGERLEAWQSAHPGARWGDEEVLDATGTIAYEIAERADIEVLRPLAVTLFWDHVADGGTPAWYGMQGALRDAVYDSLQTYLEGKAGRVFEVS